MSDYFEVSNIVEELMRQADYALNTRRYNDSVQVLMEILDYPPEYVGMEIYREAYELLVRIIRESNGRVALDILPLIIAGRLIEDPIVDMNLGLAMNELEQYKVIKDPNLFKNCRDKIVQWLIENTGEFARVKLDQISSDLNITLNLVERIVNYAIFDGYIIGKLDPKKKELVVMPYTKDKRQLKCIVCYEDLDFDTPDLVRCKYCGTVAHRAHILQWVAVAGKKCPRCMSMLELE